MSTNSIPFPTPVNPAKPGHVTRTGPQPHLEIQTVTDLVQELTQLPFRTSDDYDDLYHIGCIGQSIVQYLHHLGYYFDAPVDVSAADVPHSGYESRDVIQPLSSSGVKNAEKPQTTQPNSLNDGQIARQDRAGIVSDTPPATIEPTQEQQRRHHWCELGDFFVSFGFVIDETGKKRFQTRVHHSQADQSAQWPGLAIGQLVIWMLRQTNLLQPAEDKLAPTATPESVQVLPAPVLTPSPNRPQTINQASQKSSQPCFLQPLPHRPVWLVRPQRTPSAPVSFINFLMILYAVARVKHRRT